MYSFGLNLHGAVAQSLGMIAAAVEHVSLQFLLDRNSTPLLINFRDIKISLIPASIKTLKG
jgi:hypothetical protein